MLKNNKSILRVHLQIIAWQTKSVESLQLSSSEYFPLRLYEQVNITIQNKI
jgi:hypothetical protein